MKFMFKPNFEKTIELQKSYDLHTIHTFISSTLNIETDNSC